MLGPSICLTLPDRLRARLQGRRFSGGGRRLVEHHPLSSSPASIARAT